MVDFLYKNLVLTYTYTRVYIYKYCIYIDMFRTSFESIDCFKDLVYTRRA